MFRTRILRRLLRPWLGREGAVGCRNEAVREAWIERNLLAIPAGARILDAGAGELQYRRFCAHLRYVSQDFAQYDGKGNGVGAQRGSWDQSRIDIVSDIASIPEPDASFDAVMCIEVLEHVPHPVDALRELARLLRPGGTLLLTAPFCCLTHMAPYLFYSGYSEYFHRHWLPKLGFRDVEIEHNGNYFEYMAQEIRRTSDVRRRYTNIEPDPVEKDAMRVVLGYLNRLSAANQGSERFLYFGAHVKAVKN